VPNRAKSLHLTYVSASLISARSRRALFLCATRIKPWGVGRTAVVRQPTTSTSQHHVADTCPFHSRLLRSTGTAGGAPGVNPGDQCHHGGGRAAVFTACSCFGRSGVVDALRRGMPRPQYARCAAPPCTRRRFGWLPTRQATEGTLPSLPHTTIPSPYFTLSVESRGLSRAIAKAKNPSDFSLESEWRARSSPLWCALGASTKGCRRAAAEMDQLVPDRLDTNLTRHDLVASVLCDPTHDRAVARSLSMMLGRVSHRLSDRRLL
jgi:hypothetical protein